VLREVIQRSPWIEIAEWTTDPEPMETFVRKLQLEGIVAKQSDSRYEPGRRSGAWVKLRFNKRQEFVIGGYTPSDLGLDALLVGFYAGKELRFAGAVRAGFIPRTRREVHDQIKALAIQRCPFANLPDKRAGQWGHLSVCYTTRILAKS
jgi:bifunctional non-homologous end joining protein LigD